MKGKKRTSREVGKIDEDNIILVDQLNWQLKTKKGKHWMDYYYPTLNDMMIDLADMFVLDNIKNISDLKELNENLEKFKKKITNFIEEYERGKETNK